MSAHPMQQAIAGIVKFLLIDPTPGCTAEDLIDYHVNAAQFHRSMGNVEQAEWADQLAAWAREAIQ
ncbi:hypothetical protein [Rhodococcoides fascians]|uniref:hypothetical protein n=1 Tax=Rhodococcoides fascians TaxID=1828 RepID=UPI00050C1D4A|nr:hypothetical protein [Rhodococcus fascians]